MQAPMKMFLTVLGAIAAFFVVLVIAGEAAAANCGCVTPPTCCSPPTPPTPPTTPCCQPPGHTVTIPGVNVYVGSTIVVNANVSAQASAQGAASGSGQATVVLNSGGGGGGGGFTPGNQGLIQNLAVVGGASQLNRESYEASRTVTKKVVIQAVCIDDKDVPHPASQVTPDKEIDDSYDNELYRCIAGTHMQYTVAAYDGRIDFSHGQTISCLKNDALYHAPGGHVACRPQKPARDCNERSLLRRFGAGVKILVMVTTEKYSAFREQQTESSSTAGGGAISLDGGVGGVTF